MARPNYYLEVRQQQHSHYPLITNEYLFCKMESAANSQGFDPRVIRIRKGDSVSKRVAFIISLLEDSVPVKIVNQDNSFQKLLSIVEKTKTEMNSKIIPVFQYNNLSSFTPDSLSQKPVAETNSVVNLSLVKNLKHERTQAQISIILTRDEIPFLDSNLDWSLQKF